MAASSLHEGHLPDALEEAALQSSRSASAELIRHATSPQSLTIVKGLISSYFHRLNLRQLPQVISLLLLQLFLARQENSPRTRRQANTDSSEARELKKKVQELMKQNSKYKEKYDELYTVNQHWALDYEALKKQLREPAAKSLPAAPCTKCSLMEREINAKGELLLEVQHSLQKLKVRNQDAEAELEERTRELDTVSKALEHQHDKSSEAIYLERELLTLREKYRISEMERMKMQTELNKLKETVWNMHMVAIPRDQMRTAATFTDGVSQSHNRRSPASPSSPRPTQSSFNTKPYPTNAGTPPGYLSRGQSPEEGHSVPIVMVNGATHAGLPGPLTKCSSQYLDTSLLPQSYELRRPVSAPCNLQLSQEQLESKAGSRGGCVAEPHTSNGVPLNATSSPTNNARHKKLLTNGLISSVHDYHFNI